VALAAITGEPLSAFPRKPRRGGMSSFEVDTALRLCGYRLDVLRFARGERLPLHRLLARIPGARGILAVPGHWMAFEGLLVLDAWSLRATWVHDHPARRRKVHRVTVVYSAGSLEEDLRGFLLGSRLGAGAMLERVAARELRR